MIGAKTTSKARPTDRPTDRRPGPCSVRKGGASPEGRGVGGAAGARTLRIAFRLPPLLNWPQLHSPQPPSPPAPLAAHWQIWRAEVKVSTCEGGWGSFLSSPTLLHPHSESWEKESPNPGEGQGWGGGGVHPPRVNSQLGFCERRHLGPEESWGWYPMYFSDLMSPIILLTQGSGCPRMGEWRATPPGDTRPVTPHRS